MSLLGFFSSKEKITHRVVIDVGSHAVKTILFATSPSRPMPVALKKIVTVLPAVFSPEEVFRQLHETLFLMVRELGKVPERVLIGVGPEIAVFSLASWHVPFRGKGNIPREEMASLFSNLAHQRRGMQQEGVAYPLELFANGYSVAADTLATLDRRGIEEIGFSTLLLSYTPRIGVALSELKKKWGGIPLEYVPLAICYREAMMRVGTEEALLVDVGGAFTTLLLVKEKKLVQVAAFPRGAHHFVEGIAAIMGISWDEAEDLKRQYGQRTMRGGAQARLQKFFAEEAKLWEHLFREAVESLYSVGPLPAGVLLCGGGAYLPEIQSSLRSPAWLYNLSFHASPVVQLWEGWRVFDGNSFGGFLQGPEDTGLASLMAYTLFHRPLLG